MSEDFQIIVVGGGHAGIEAALASARLGMETCLLTLKRDTVGAMSCNPAIGGLGKSQIVREIDALGGEMGRAADATAIHFKRLNRSKGPAVRARRVQCDLGLYKKYMLSVLESCKKLTLLEGMVASLLFHEQGVCGVSLEDGRKLKAKAVVITTGTFLNGLAHVGEKSFPAGRLGDPPAVSLSESLRRAGLRLGRLKTGTPARLDASSLQFMGLEAQLSEDDPLSFSHEGLGRLLGKVSCFMTRTNQKTHEIIRNGLSRSPLFQGVIKGRGPRYCPSIEDKVVRFPERTSHQIILEPTDLGERVIYPNGISTSLPQDVQEDMIHSIVGLEKAKLISYGYAIEYDFVPPDQLRPNLEAKKIPGLFLAGQINGTSGYEEAAGQGLIAGINAACKLTNKPFVILSRHEAYIGVMIDDLVTRGTEEPYRMFSSRAEFRLMLREDNSAVRLNDWAGRIGLVTEETLAVRRKNLQCLNRLLERLKATYTVQSQEGRISLEKVLRRPEITLSDLATYLSGEYSQDVLEQAEVMVKYQGYIDRQQREAARMQQMENRKIPPHLAFTEIPGLSKELAEKLSQKKPLTFGQASRIDGMTPAALMVLSVWIRKLDNVPRGTLQEDPMIE